MIIVTDQLSKRGVFNDPLRRGFICRCLNCISCCTRRNKACSSCIKFFANLGSGNWVDKIVLGEEKNVRLPPKFIDFLDSPEDESEAQSESKEENKGLLNQDTNSDTESKASSSTETDFGMHEPNVTVKIQEEKDQEDSVINTMIEMGEILKPKRSTD